MSTKYSLDLQPYWFADDDLYFMALKKTSHGGKRKGAGRPKTKEDTVVMRIPVSKVEAVKKVIGKK